MSQSHEPRENPRLNQGHALDVAAERLEAEFAGTFSRETIRQFLDTSHAEFNARATVVNYLPLLAERFARQRLQAHAHTQSTADKPAVLFLCVHNAGKSQMALGLFQQYAGDRAVAWSGGSEPGNELNQYSVQAMAEIGIDITGEFPKPWSEETLKAADVVVTMGCGDACPVYPGKKYLDWDLDAPPGNSLENVRPVRDEIDRRVRALLTELGVPVEVSAHSAAQ
jgi:protein-tyrosine-phosphatase